MKLLNKKITHGPRITCWVIICKNVWSVAATPVMVKIRTPLEQRILQLKQFEI